MGRAELPLGPNIRAAQQRSPTAGWFMASIHVHILELLAPHEPSSYWRGAYFPAGRVLGPGVV